MSKRHMCGLAENTAGQVARRATRRGGVRARAMGRLRNFRRANDGATAIEFALLALPFCVLLFSILELAIIFFITAALDHGTAQAARQIRTGELQASETSKTAQLKAFRDRICEEMAGLADCDTRLRVDLVSDVSFTTATLPPVNLDSSARRPGDDYKKNPDGSYVLDSDGKRVREEPTPPPASNFACSAPRKVVLLRAEFYHDLTLPRALTFLGNDPDGWNRRILTSTTAFRNEPFPATAGSSC